MVCPNCGSNMSDKRKRCERCGTDLTLYKKILRASDLYYNNGLARARVRDLSGAIIALRNSLELNKNHINARNLLGLIYYEMGETVDALSEWVISKHFKPDDNDADEYINKVQSNPTKLDALNQAIKRYNTALNYAKQRSDDLAIIQLKKVTSLNPHFIRAYHLLALLFMKNGENDKAMKYLNRAAKIDVSNTTTLRYMREIEGPEASSKDQDSNPEAEKSYTSSIMPVSSYKEDKPNIMAFVNLVVGVILGIAVTAFLIIPTIRKEQKVNENTNLVDYGTGLAKIEEQEETISSLRQEKEELEQKVSDLQIQIDDFEVPEDKSVLYEPLFVASMQYMEELEKPEKDREIMEIADLLATIDEKKYEGEASADLLTSLKDKVYPEANQTHYDEGHDLYSTGKYEEALVELEKALIFDPKDEDALYFIARSYHRLDDFENAALYYNIILTDFPDSKRAKDTKENNFLEQVQE